MCRRIECPRSALNFVKVCPSPVYKMAPFGQRYCEVCDIYITRKNFCQHLRTRRHMEMAARLQQPAECNNNIEKPPKKKPKLVKANKVHPEEGADICTNDNAQFDFVDSQSSQAIQNNYPDLSAEDIIHYMKQLNRPLNDLTPPCDCLKCAEAAKYLLDMCDNIESEINQGVSKLSNSDQETDQVQRIKSVDKTCIDFNSTYHNLIAFPPTSTAEEKKIETWNSIVENSKQNVEENEVQTTNEENKENIPPPNFPNSSAPCSSPYQSIKFARQFNTHSCSKFGEDLPEYLKFSHCHEEMFHFIGIKDERTNCNVLLAVMK